MLFQLPRGDTYRRESSLHDGENASYEKTDNGQQANCLAAVFECLGHHRVGQHGQYRARGERLSGESLFRDLVSDQCARGRNDTTGDGQEYPQPEHGAVWCSDRFQTECPGDPLRDVGDEDCRHKRQTHRPQG